MASLTLLGFLALGALGWAWLFLVYLPPLERDAARYRWLRNASTADDGIEIIFDSTHKDVAAAMKHGLLDTGVDIAMFKAAERAKKCSM